MSAQQPDRLDLEAIKGRLHKWPEAKANYLAEPSPETLATLLVSEVAVENLNVDQVRALVAEVERLRALVCDAYVEGFNDAESLCGPPPLSVDGQERWLHSSARAALREPPQ